MEGSPSCDVPAVIDVEANASAMVKLAFSLCDIHEKKGSSYRVTCRVCGMSVTTNANKLLYGHYLGENGKDIRSCVTKEKLREEYPFFMAECEGRQTKIAAKRK